MEFSSSRDVIISTNTSTPIPPIQWVRHRQKLIPIGRLSISCRIVEPVVVKPDTVSKNASMYAGMLPEMTNGSAPKADHRSQASATMAKLSLP